MDLCNQTCVYPKFLESVRMIYIYLYSSMIEIHEENNLVSTWRVVKKMHVCLFATLNYGFNINISKKRQLILFIIYEMLVYKVHFDP